MEFTEFFNKYIKPFVALLILITLVCLLILLSNEHRLKEEISENCGWKDETYRCYCEYNKVMEIEDLINGSLEIGDVELVG